ncbi:ATP-dependent DNA ligase [Antiquaquibacter soli]|uniref:DNA ligase (ATP) n=1 Tax=Antiquaquibacter soli TaxID=3064523 RepID=A0ABT9BM21_9MICO|nr:ATP-dependent DNA ligase [Protaetiibacter sp. WY-16]MDO7881649.1 ATP-dependent DNA ligase [Protaetiibacter sp. WY-16]
MAAAAGDDQVVTIDGHRLKLTSLNKVLYPETGTTKADVLDYYARVAEPLIRHAANRPVTRKRWVNGVGTADDPGEMFFQKNLDDRSTPQWVLRRDIQHSDHVNSYPLVNDLATLTWFGQIAALELHVPQWQFGRTGVRKNPDRLVLDLDPGPGAGLPECAEVARLARRILKDMGLDPFPVTSGSKGIHLYAALDGKQTSDQVSDVAHELARALEADHPDLIVSDMKKTLREGKVLVDWSQNNGSKTTIAPYSLRGRAHPMVAAPRTWKELESPTLAHLDYREVIRRVEKKGDLLADLTAGHLASLEPTPERMAGFIAAGGPDDRLATYRSMRDGDKTPEPVPAEAPPTSSGNSFVIQEHHATRLHWDFRLEHDGVLVSWALPKGVPTDPGKNHLAVQTEDHPLAYGAFEGVIPAGQYGAGEVTIWDRGTYDLEKWRDGKEVIATLHGEKHGSHRYALIQTGGRDGDENNWLIHLMKPVDEQPPRHARADSRRKVIGGTRPPRAASERSLSPMLASPGTLGELGDTDEWAFEMKWDGVRTIAEVRDGTVRLWSRNGVDVTATYPELQALPGMLRTDAVLDGEVIALNAAGRPDFGVLQKRMKLAKPKDVEPAMATTPVQFMVFDLLELDGESLVQRPWSERRERLEAALSPGGAIQLPPVFDGDARAAVATSRQLGLEGVMAKRRASAYLAGKRASSWIKIKHHLSQEVVIGGWRPGSGTRAHQVGSLLMGVPGTDGLEYVGRVGTGFSDRMLAELGTRLRRLERKTSPFVEVPGPDASDAHWVTPSIVGEVEFSEWTPTGKLRHPSWRGLRPDKDPEDVHRESELG